MSRSTSGTSCGCWPARGMIAGRFRWRAHSAKLPGRIGLAAFTFEPGALPLTEASTRPSDLEALLEFLRLDEPSSHPAITRRTPSDP